MSIIPNSDVFVIKVEPVSPSHSQNTDEGNEYETLLLQEVKYQPPSTAHPNPTPARITKRRDKEVLEPAAEAGAAPVPGPDSGKPQSEMSSTSEIKKFMEALLEKLGQEKVSRNLEGTKRTRADAFENGSKEIPGTASGIPNAGSTPSTQTPQQAQKKIKIASKTLPERENRPPETTTVESGSLQAAISAGKPKTKAEPQRKKVKLSSGIRGGPVMSVTPFIAKSTTPKRTSGILHFFECPTCCQQFIAKPAAQQHFRTCKKPFNSKANSLKFL